jgi:hypothetical protein
MVVIIVFRSLGGKDSEWLDMKIGWVTQRNTTESGAESCMKKNTQKIEMGGQSQNGTYS